MALKKIAYIVSHQRSGSTLLSMLLGSHPEMFCVGELRLLGKYLNSPKGICLCGNHLDQCPFWTKILSDLEKNPKTLATSLKIKRWHLILNTGYGRAKKILPSLPRYAYFKKHDMILNDLIEIYHKAATETGMQIVIDSSKHPFTGRFLYSALPGQVKLIFLIRDGRGFVNSLKKRGVSIKKAAKMWLHAVQKMRMIRLGIPEDNLFFLKYEELCREPKETMGKLCSFLDVPYHEDMLIVNKTDKHDIAGSPSITRSSRKRISISYDESWRMGLDNTEIQTFHNIAGKMNSLLGYH